MKTDYKNTFIYGLTEKGTKEIKYVGKSNNPKRRMQQHVCDSANRKTPKDYWIQSVLKKGCQIDLIILEEVEYDSWEEKEKYWINFYKNKIKNCSEGGYGGRPIKYEISYDETKKWIKENIPKINSQTKWFKNIKNLPNFISPYPRDTYIHRGWISWGDFFGTNRIGDNEKAKSYINYDEAKKYIKSLNIKVRKNWNCFIKSNKFPSNLPKRPDRFYKNKGWVSWYDFFGTKKNEYPDYNEALKIANSLKIKSSSKWRELAKLNGGQLNNLPYSPEKVYKNKGWVSWYDWLNKKREN